MIDGLKTIRIRELNFHRNLFDKQELILLYSNVIYSIISI